MFCKLKNTKPIFINDGLLNLKPINIVDYLELHKAIINDKTYLLLNGHEFDYFRDLNTKIRLFELKYFIKNIKNQRKITVESIEKILNHVYIIFRKKISS